MIRTFAAAIAVVMALCGTVNASGMPDQGPELQVLSCRGVSSYGGAGLLVDFHDGSTSTYKTVVWRGMFGTRPIDFIDAGPFQAGREAQHVVWSPSDSGARPQFYSLEGTCRAIETQTRGGEIWTDPAVVGAPAIPTATPHEPLPTARPDNAPSVPAIFYNPLHNPVGIVACSFGFQTVRKRGYAAMNIRFRNLSQKTISRIVFRGLYGDGGVDFTYGGTFSPGLLISSTQWGNALVGKIPRLTRSDLGEGLPPDYNDVDDNPMNCTAVNVRYADGTVWENSSVPQTVPLPTPQPDHS